MDKILRISSFLMLILLTSYQYVYAHKPQEIKLEYDHKQEILIVEIKHRSADMKDHFIRKMEVYKNDEEIDLIHYKRQTTPSLHIVSLDLPADNEDELRVKVSCAEGGVLEEKITITIDEEQ